MKHHQYFVYIVTNESKKVLYVGVTNNLPQRIKEHYLNKDKQDTFAGKYNCHYLLYFESFKYIDKAIEREKEIKGWTRKRKDALIASENAEWRFLNTDIFEQWPPSKDEISMRGDKE
jgi:putative endonuclease